MNKANRTVVIIFGVVVLLILFVGASLLDGWGYGGWGRMGPGMMGGWGFGPLGWIGMLFMWLIPVSFVVLVVLGIIWLVRAVGNTGGPVASTRVCPHCGRAAQADWHTCPYCGQALP
jgi:hypothetical protein